MKAILLPIFLFVHSFLFGGDIASKCKLYCFYTPDFKSMYEQYFLPSIKDDFEVIAKVYPQDCPSGNFRSVGWEKTMLNKLLLLKEAIKENWNDQVFIYSDIDIIFLKSFLSKALESLGNRDFVVQQGFPKKKICAGFFVMRGNERTLKLVDQAYRLLEAGHFEDDQQALQDVLDRLPPDSISWGFLPAGQFANGRRVLKKTMSLYSKASELELPDEILLFHANCSVGLDDKYHFLRRVQKLFVEREYRRYGFLNVETLPLLRTKQYSMNEASKIVVFSAPRTGSSLVYNVLRYLFEDDQKLFSKHFEFRQDRRVLKSHKFTDLENLEDGNNIYFFTIRNPIDASISNFRIAMRQIGDLEEFAKELIYKHHTYLIFSEELEAKGCHVERLKYEDFTQDFDSLFDRIEKCFAITIAFEDRDIMRKGYSKENIHEAVKDFIDFKEYHPLSGFHGKHVAMETFTPPVVFERALSLYFEEVKPLFIKYGYSLQESIK